MMIKYISIELLFMYFLMHLRHLKQLNMLCIHINKLLITELNTYLKKDIEINKLFNIKLLTINLLNVDK
jgi:hypothetical protein